jgi:hypothetical protein
LGYDRARVLLKQYTATGGSDGLELQQLRHSAATHLGDQKVPLQLIMAKTRHKSPRTDIDLCGRYRLQGNTRAQARGHTRQAECLHVRVQAGWGVASGLGRAQLGCHHVGHHGGVPRQRGYR